jgi:hypothetical protein
VLDKDVLPAIGDKPVAEVTIPDILAITDAVKARGADQMALQTRNVIKRLYAYAIARGKTRFNPAAAIEARFIATARSRDVALLQAAGQEISLQSSPEVLPCLAPRCGLVAHAEKSIPRKLNCNAYVAVRQRILHQRENAFL